MRVEVAVDWSQKPERPRQDNPSNDLSPPRSRAERRLWYIAIAREIEAGVRAGRFGSYADAARRCRVSRARLSVLVGKPFRTDDLPWGRPGSHMLRTTSNFNSLL